ncbi:MAG: ATP-dependent helicase RhlE [Pseudomonadota bacterium]
MTFDSLNLAPAILEAVRNEGYTEPTPIQAQAIPAVLEGHDILAGAQTGTGKTAAFTLPMLQLLSQKPGSGHIRALVLTPTRELAAQVEESVKTYGAKLSLQSTVVFGGVGLNPQIQRIKQGVDILVATPGRLLDLAQQGAVDLSRVEILVLDEADRMLDMGFIHDVRKVLALLPKSKQSLLFSATFSDEIRELANTLLREPKQIQVTPRNTTVELIKQAIYPVGRERKKDLLLHLMQEANWAQVLVFTRTKFGANRVADFLSAHGIPAMALHGNKSQTARTQALQGFKTGDVRALVATDIAARGIDIDELPHVVNFDIPNITEDYVHRIGRTGRAGATGEAISLVSLDEEGFMQDIERFIQLRLDVRLLPEFGPAEGETAQPIAMGRQVLWGGLGKAPGRDVMSAAAKAARQEMMQRMRERKSNEGGGNGHRNHRGPSTGSADGGEGPEGGNRNRRSRNRRRGGGASAGAPSQGQGGAPRRQHDGQPSVRQDSGQGRAPRRDNDELPRSADPLKTSVDAAARGGRNRFRSGGGGGGNGGGNRERGNIDPLRTSFGRIK